MKPLFKIFDLNFSPFFNDAITPVNTSNTISAKTKYK